MEWQKEEEPLSFSFVALELKFNFVINHDMRTFSFLFFFLFLEWTYIIREVIWEVT